MIIASDQFHSSVRGIEVESGKEDQIAIDDSGLDVLTCYMSSKSLGRSEP